MLSILRLATIGALPLWVALLGVFFWGADAPIASLLLSAMLLSLGAVIAGFSATGPKPGEIAALVVFAVFFLSAILKGWMSSGAHEYSALAACGALLYGMRRSCRTASDTQALWTVLLLAGGVIAGLAFWDFIADPRTAFGTPRPYHIDRLSWPFLSANTAATFYGLVGLLASAELMRQVRHISGISFSQKLEDGIKRLAPAGIVVALTVTDLLLTGSRAGISLGIGALLFLVVWDQVAQRRTGSGPGRSLIILSVIVAVGIAVMLSGQIYWSRLQSLDQDSRPIILAAYLEAVRLAPWLGHGLGGFSLTNDLIADASNANTLQGQGAAHNLGLQWLIQAGLVGSAVGLSALLGVGGALMGGLRRRRRQTSYLRAVLVGLGLVLAHGTVDYAVEIPLFAWFLSAVLGLGLATADRGRSAKADGAQRSRASLVARVLTVAGFLGLAVWAAAALDDRLNIRQLETASDEAVMEIASRPMQGNHSAYWYDALGQRLYNLPVPDGRAATEALEAAVAKEPRDGHLWLRLAYARTLADGRFSPAAAEALEHSYYRLPYGEPDMRAWRLGFCDANWRQLGSALQSSAMREARIANRTWLRRNLSGPLATPDDTT